MGAAMNMDNRFGAQLDELNQLLAQAEVRIVASSHLVAASTPLPGGGSLHLRTVDGEWCLAIETAGTPGKFSPWHKSTRGCRVAMASALETLERAIAAAEEDFGAELARAIDAAREFLE